MVACGFWRTCDSHGPMARIRQAGAQLRKRIASVDGSDSSASAKARASLAGLAGEDAAASLVAEEFGVARSIFADGGVSFSRSRNEAANLSGPCADDDHAGDISDSRRNEQQLRGSL